MHNLYAMKYNELSIDCGNASRVSHTSKLGTDSFLSFLILATSRLKTMVYSCTSLEVMATYISINSVVIFYLLLVAQR